MYLEAEKTRHRGTLAKLSKTAYIEIPSHRSVLPRITRSQLKKKPSPGGIDQYNLSQRNTCVFERGGWKGVGRQPTPSALKGLGESNSSVSAEQVLHQRASFKYGNNGVPGLAP